MASVTDPATGTVDSARGLWNPAGHYLNTASYGLPPRPGWDALQEALAQWRAGETSWEGWSTSTEAARRSWARLVGVAPEQVAVGSVVSSLVGLVAASVPDGARIVMPDVDFTSLQWPWLVHSDRGVEVESVPVRRLAEAIDSRTHAVAFSAVQSATGEVADVESIIRAAKHHGALTVVDATQACGWLPLHGVRFDAIACGAYKWLMSPRGSAFMAVGPALMEDLRPAAANWFAGEDVHDSYYGLPLRLAQSARRFDTSPAWFSWVGTAPALEVIETIGIEKVHEHDVSLANDFRAGLGHPPSNSAIVSADIEGATAKLEGAGIKAAVRAGSLRASFHVYNTGADVDAALNALTV
jgi:selenocysteine lyase/cysteine desulfurase